MKYLLSFFALLIFVFSTAAQSTNNSRPNAPNFKVQSLDGKIFDSSQLKGKIVVLNLWFVNCPNCIEEITALNKIVETYESNKDVVFLGLATNGKPELQKFLSKHPFKFNIVPNAGDFMLFAFGDKQKNGSYYLPFPTHVFIDRDGKIVFKTSGIKGVEAVKTELAKQLGK